MRTATTVIAIFIIVMSLATCGSPGPAPTPKPTDLLAQVLDFYKTGGYPQTCGDYLAKGTQDQAVLAEKILTTLRSFVGAPRGALASRPPRDYRVTRRPCRSPRPRQ